MKPTLYFILCLCISFGFSALLDVPWVQQQIIRIIIIHALVLLPYILFFFYLKAMFKK